VTAVSNDCCECCHPKAQIFTELDIVHPTFVISRSETIHKVAIGEIVLEHEKPPWMPKKKHHGSGKDEDMQF